MIFPAMGWLFLAEISTACYGWKLENDSRDSGAAREQVSEQKKKNHCWLEI